MGSCLLTNELSAIILKLFMIRCITHNLHGPHRIHFRHQAIRMPIRGFGVWQKLMFTVRGLLNRLANEDHRSLKSNNLTDPNAHETSLKQVLKPVPRNSLQAEQHFQSNELSVSNLQKSRLERIDQILGTRTHFHETKLYQQRIDSSHVLNLSRLYKQFRETPREQLDMMNPQVRPSHRWKNKKKYYNNFKKLKKYPSARLQLQTFVEKNADIYKPNQESESELIKMLGEEALFTKLSLADLDLTLESVHREKVYIQAQNRVIEPQFDEQPYNLNGFTYFRPKYTMSLYRVKSSQFSARFQDSVTYLSQNLSPDRLPENWLQQLISLDEIYEALKQFYFDERVNEYLGKVENQVMEYFISSIYVSNDCKHLVAVIDLLGTKKEYVSLYKYTGVGSEVARKIQPNHVIFNILPGMALRDDGILYCIQRSEQGLYTELVKMQFDHRVFSKPVPAPQMTAPPPNNSDPQTQTVPKTKEQTEQQTRSQIIYRCLPYKSLRIIAHKQASLPTKSHNPHYQTSTNIIFQQFEPRQATNNHIYLLQHSTTNYQSPTDLISLITPNTSSQHQIFNSLPKHLQSKYVNMKSNSLWSECYEVMGIGYLVVRYQLIGGSQSERGKTIANQLKYGPNVTKIAEFVTLVPYAGIETGGNAKQISGSANQIQELNSQQSTVATYELIDQKLNYNNHQLTKFPSGPSETIYKLSHHNEQLVYVCPQQHYFIQLKVEHCSQSNIYLLMNTSIESIYNSHSLSIHPLRVGVKPYSLYLDGNEIELIDRQGLTPGLIHLKLHTPVLSTNITYQLWKKQLRERENQRVHGQSISIEAEGVNGAEEDIEIRVVTLQKYVKNHNNPQPVILYLPSQSETMDQMTVAKILEKGVMMVQITKCPGMFGSDMITLLRGTKSLFAAYLNAIIKTIEFIRGNLGKNIGLYAKGGPSCHLSYLLNVLDNQNGQMFSASVLHQGLYDLSQQNCRNYEYFYGTNMEIWQNINPIKFKVINPKTDRFSHSPSEPAAQTPMISNLTNILLTSCHSDRRAQSRKLIHSLRKCPNMFFDEVYLKEFDNEYQCDLYNLSFLYHKLKADMVQSSMKQHNNRVSELNDTMINKHSDR